MTAVSHRSFDPSNISILRLPQLPQIELGMLQCPDAFGVDKGSEGDEPEGVAQVASEDDREDRVGLGLLQTGETRPEGGSVALVGEKCVAVVLQEASLFEADDHRVVEREEENHDGRDGERCGGEADAEHADGAE